MMLGGGSRTQEFPENCLDPKSPLYSLKRGGGSQRKTMSPTLTGQGWDHLGPAQGRAKLHIKQEPDLEPEGLKTVEF